MPKQHAAPYYPWQVVYDPARMYTGPFREIDLRLTAEAGYWPEGIIFQHKRTGEKKTFLNGHLITLSPSPPTKEQTL